MTRRFSSQQLTYLRNQVPISQVIEALPTLATRNTDGKLHFACPLCHGFNTSVYTQHNLGRCFNCLQNFNPIELVMHQLQISFVQSVNWLIQRTSNQPVRNPTTTVTNCAQPTHIGDILSNMLAMASKTKSNALPNESIQQRISNLERQIVQLYRMLNQLQKTQNHK